MACGTCGVGTVVLLRGRGGPGYRKPLVCYVHHRLRLFTNPDGMSYRRCIRCGEDHYDGRGDNNLNGNVISAIVGATPGM